MDYGLVLFTSDRGITPAAAAKLAEDHGFTTFYVPEHTHIPVKREAAHPTTGDESLPDDRYMRTLDPWVSLGTASRGDLAGAAVDGRGTARRARPDHAGQVDRHPRPPLRRPGQPRRRIRLEHRRTRRPQRAPGPAAHHAARVHRGHARAVDPGGSRVRRRVREVRAVMGLAEARAAPHPGAGRRGGHREELQVDRPKSADGWITTPRDFDIDEPVKLLQDTWAAAGRDGAPQIVALDFKPDPDKLARWPSSASPRCCSACPTSPKTEVAAYVERLAGKLAALV